ncbi:MAG: cytochrome c oxidase subunit 3 [Planctomycetota bacterium]
MNPTAVTGHEAASEESEPGFYGTSWQKLMMWWFIIGDAILFGSFLAAYGFARISAGSWPDRTQMFSMNFITVMTFTLITSSATMATAVAASRRGDRKAAFNFTMATAIGGIAFLGMQAYEWYHLIHNGARMGTNPWGAPAFGAYFFTITGFHGSHVASGVLILLITAWNAKRGKSGPEGVELTGLYWHFVDLVWVFVFGCFYLI